MQVKELLKYIKDPSQMSEKSIPVLQKLVADFPYLQSGHILLSIASQRWDTSVYQKSIKKTAIVVTDREHLYTLIHNSEQHDQSNETETIVQVAGDQKQENDNVISVSIKEEVIANLASNADEKPVVKVDEDAVEKEIEKALVESLVGTEIKKISDETEAETSEPVEPEKTPQSAKFGDWLHFLKKNNGETYQEIEEKVRIQKIKDIKEDKGGEEKKQKVKQKQKELIDKIIDTNPGIIRQKEEQKFFKSDLKAKESLLENEHLVTETLAQIYAAQGNIYKAIRAYEILSLKFPQKSVYFASLIQKLKNNQ